ncbi:hypothetical protein [Streptomyces sp. ISL-66]|uniref:hypothetical protein n=1 Tax=Streptomyces sp. ISL-66 TaxID=2819186 RepID=UPI0027E456F8|nr:hypothetical protein [Streptomyces sp. ISL-66]
MLVEALTAVAALGGGAVVQAAGTDAWLVVRERAAALLGRGDTARGRAELERLDRTARALEPEAAVDPEQERLRQEGEWRTRFEMLLESLDAREQERTAQELRTLVSYVADAAGDVAVATGRAVASGGGSAVTGVKRTGDDGRSARVMNTGDAEATGAGSSAVSGIVRD